MVLNFISRLVLQKGIYEVVAAVKNLAPEFPKMRLHVVGNIDKNSPESITQDFIDQHQDENVNFLGRRKDIAELLAITDLYVFPSYYREGLPRTCLEALATGLPIITTDMPGCNLCIDEGLNGYLIEPKSIEKVENAIRRICEDNSIERMGLHSRKIAEERFQNKLVYQQIEAKYREIFANPS